MAKQATKQEQTDNLDSWEGNEMTYGIGRIPQDTDPTAEQMATIEAEEMMRPSRRPRKQCSRCGRMTRELMSSSTGSVCPDCYDDASN